QGLKPTPRVKLILWWDANEGRVVAQGGSPALSSAGTGGGRVGWRGSPPEPGCKPTARARGSGDRDRLSGGRIDFPARNHPADVPLARCREGRRLLANRGLVRRWSSGNSRHLQGRAPAHRQDRSGLRRRHHTTAPAPAPVGGGAF